MHPFRLLASVLLALALALPLAAGAQEDPSPVPPEVTFVVSSGYWEHAAETQADAAAAAGDATPATDEAQAAAPRRGYYKLFALRQADGTATIHLQQIEATAGGPKIVSSTELEEFTALRPYVTDMRPETSTGITAQPGLFITVYLKTDPQAVEPESWTVLIDDLGDIRVEKATN
ncbi:hypothetical protein LXM94_24410 [Rhizobium sp. TRM95111]|uniref:hypothetical protein n=1 Tax=Rhizobium alarense TaxID=2846851 RepID=UPI001F3FDFAE|nr:hypothetical protein [Rhizobium alarense]MCF3643104.1 hypothetical protein [Rhizobium alarense]